MTPTLTAFERSPDGGLGLARDTRVRWALEEAGQACVVRFVSFRALKEPAHLALHPFGRIPTWEEGDLVLFESGAIVLHLGQRSEVLLPGDPRARARAIQWMVAALNSIEPFVVNAALIDTFYADQEWAKLRRQGAREFAQRRLTGLALALGDKPYLDGDRFTAGDLIMTTVLRIMPDLIEDRRLSDYVDRCTFRPAFRRALEAQLSDFCEDEAA